MSLPCDLGQLRAELITAMAMGLDLVAVRAKCDHVLGIIWTANTKLQNVIDLDKRLAPVVHVIRLPGAVRVTAFVLVPAQHGLPGACRSDPDGDGPRDRVGHLPLEESTAQPPVFRLPGCLCRSLREEITEIRQRRIPQDRLVQPLQP